MRVLKRQAQKRFDMLLFSRFVNVGFPEGGVEEFGLAG